MNPPASDPLSAVERARVEGRRAFEDGRSVATCPYDLKRQRKQRQAWCDAWFSAAASRRRRQLQAASNTAADHSAF